MKNKVIIFIFLGLCQSILGMESAQSPSLEALEEIIKAPGTAFEDGLFKDLQSTPPTQIPTLIQQLDYSIENLSSEGSNKILSILQNISPELQVKIFRDLLDNKEWQLAVKWTGWIDKTKGELVPVLQPYITNLIREKNISALGSLIILIPDKDPLRQHVELAIKDFMAEKAQRGEYGGVFGQRQAGFKTLEEQDKEVNEAIAQAKQNPTGTNLESLKNLQAQYRDNPVQGPKLQQAIQEVIDILQKRGATVQPVSPTTQEVGDIKLLISDQEITIPKALFKKLAYVSKTIETNLEDLGIPIAQLDEFNIGPIPTSSFELIMSMLDELVAVKQAPDAQVKTQAEDKLVAQLQKIENPKERIDIINAAEFLEIKPLLEQINILIIPEAFKNKQEFDEYLETIKKIPQNLWNKILQQADLHYELLKYNLANKKTKVLPLEEAQSVIISPDSKLIITSAWNEVTSWDSSSGTKVNEFKHPDTITRISLSPNGKNLVTSSGLWDKSAKLTTIIWDLSSGQKLYEIDGFSRGISSDNKYIITSLRSDKKAIIWDLNSGQKLYEIDGFVSDISPNSTFVVTRSDNKALTWDLKTGQKLHELTATDTIKKTIISPNSNYIITQLEKTVIIWNAMTGKQFHDLEIPDTSDITISSNNQFLLTQLYQSTIIWNLATGKKLHTLPGKGSISPDSKYGITTTKDDILIIWDLETGNEVHTLTEGAPKYLPEGVKFAISNNSRYVVTGPVSGTDESISSIIWDLGTGKKLGELKESIYFEKINMSSDNNFVAFSESKIKPAAIWQLIDPRFKIDQLSKNQIVYLLYLLANKPTSISAFMQSTLESLPNYIQQLFPDVFKKTTPSIPTPDKPAKLVEKPTKPKPPVGEKPVTPKTPEAPIETPLPPIKPSKPTAPPGVTPATAPADLDNLYKNLQDLSSRLKQLNEKLNKI